MHGLEEEAANFLISWFHNGFLWLENIVPFTLKIIYNITKIHYKGHKILKTTDITS